MNKLLTKVVLSEQVEGELVALTSKGNCSIRKVKRANVLLLLARGQKAGQISPVVAVSAATVYNLHHRYLQQGVAGALFEKPRSGQPRKVTQQVEAEVTRLACSQAREGRVGWRVELINEQLIELGYHLHEESVR